MAHPLAARRMLAATALIATLALAACVTQQDRQRLQQGYAAYNQKNFAQASSIANDYIGRFPHDEHVDEAYYLRAITRLAAGHKADATTDLRAAMHSTSRADMKARCGRVLGDLAYDRGAYDEAIADYQAALAADPQSPEAQTYYRLGAALQAVGRWNDARTPLTRLLTLKDTGGWDDYARRRLTADAFSLQFGAFRDLAHARDLALRLRKLNIHANVYKEQRGTAPLYTVRAGTYTTLAQADAARKQLAPQHIEAVVYP